MLSLIFVWNGGVMEPTRIEMRCARIRHIFGSRLVLETQYTSEQAITASALNLFCYSLWQQCGPGSVIGIATGYGLDGRGIESRCGRDFPHLSRPALGPTQPPVQWVPGLSRGVKSSRGVTLTPHPLLVPWSRKGRAIPLLPLWAVWPVQWCTLLSFTVTTLRLELYDCVHSLRHRLY